MPLPRAVARFNRHVTNRILGPFAYVLPLFGVVVHRGRRSRRLYRTPVNVFRRPGGVVIALTYGPESDWVRNVLAAGRLPAMPKNLICKIGGLVITRQRPGTAKGFVFLTIEDETGMVNVIVRPDIYERNRRTIRSAQSVRLLGDPA